MNAPELALKISRIFQASREQVFRAWTDPELLRKWWHMSADATTPIAEVDLRVGGRYRLAMKPTDSDDLYIVGGVYQVVDPPKRLVYTWAWEEPAGQPESIVTVEFLDRGQTTEVVIEHGAFESAQRRDEHIGGWEGCLQQLDSVFTSQT